MGKESQAIDAPADRARRMDGLTDLCLTTNKREKKKKRKLDKGKTWKEKRIEKKLCIPSCLRDCTR